MDIITYLRNLIEKKEQRAAELRELIKKAGTADEVRSLGDTLQAVLDELNDAKKQLDEQEKGGGEGKEPGAEGGQEPQEGRSHNPLKEFRKVAKYGKQPEQDDDRTNSKEYRAAFMNFVCRNVPIPMELRADAVTVTGDVSAVIPTTIMQEIIREMKSYGEVFNRVRKLNVQGGVQIPILSLAPTASWIGETESSEDQKLQAKTSISFSYFGLECKISQSLLVNQVTLDSFQEMFVTLASEAMVHALESVIFNGNGSGKPLGILNDTRVPSANKITLNPTEFASWESWQKKVFAKMKKAYRTGCFIMEQGTFDGYINGMVDKNGQPIGRVNYGIDGGEVYRFGGKEVLTVEDDIIPGYDAASNSKVVAVFMKLTDYAINSNMEMTVVKWTDNDNNQLKNKAVLICDGKLVDPNGVLLIIKGAAG